MATDPTGETLRVRNVSQRILAHGATDQGMVRDENQDAFGIIDSRDAAGAEAGGILLVLADGMGGLAGGGTASRMVIEGVCETYREEVAKPPKLLRNGIRKANLLIYNRMMEMPGRVPMGSTVTAMVIKQGYACVAHVGDSRAYRIPPSGPIVKLTRDHTWVEELMKRGELEPGSIQHMIHRNILTRGVGLRPEVESDVAELTDVVPGDTFLLSSDGLHELVPESEIEARVRARGRDLQGLVDDLIQLARRAGGPDNITAVVARVESEDSEGEGAGAGSGGVDLEQSCLPEFQGPPRLFPRHGFMPLTLFAAFVLGMGTVLLLEKAPLEESRRMDIDPLETFLNDPGSQEFFNTPDGKKIRQALEEHRRKEGEGPVQQSADR